jgi:hypothetical protein
MEEQNPKQRPLLRRAEWNLRVAVEHLQRTQDPELHSSGSSAFGGADKERVFIAP